MMKCTRIWAVVALTLTTVFASTSAVHADAKKYLANDTQMIVSLNVRQIMNSKAIKDNELDAILRFFLEGQLNQNDDFRKIQKSLGFDVFRDLDRLTVAAPSTKEAKENTLVIVEGRFKSAKFQQTAAAMAKKSPEIMKIHRLGNRQVLEVTPPGEGVFYVTLADKKTLIMGQSKDRITKALARGDNNKRSSLPATVKELQRILPVNQSFSILVTSDVLKEMAKRNPNAAPFANNINNINGMIAGINIEKDVNLQVGVATTNAAAAKELNTKVVGLLFLARGWVQNQAKNDKRFEPLDNIVRTVRASSQGSSVVLRGRVSAQIIRDYAKKLTDFLP